MPRCAACGDEHPTGNSLCPRTGEVMSQGPCGSRIDRYEVERWIGGGGMGAVYVARHTMLQHAVALKLLHPSIAQRGDILERFLREARATASLGSRHIVRVHDCAVTPEGTAFIAMERLEGESAQSLLDREKKVEAGRAVEIALQALEGLGEAHAAGIVHRDMKPGNVFLTPVRAGGEHVTILDFGISKIRSANVAALTQTGTVMGTPHYMAPEQIWNAKDIDHRADLYAVGVMLYEMLSGRLPYDASTDAELLVKACTTDPIPLRDLGTGLPASLVQIVDRAMARDPSQRFQSAAEFAQSLRAARDGGARPTAPPPTAYAPPAPPPSLPNPPPQWPANAPTAWGQAPQHVWGMPPATPIQQRAPDPPKRSRRVLYVVVATVALLALCCVAGVALLLDAPAQTPQPTPQGPSMTPIGGGQTTSDQNVLHLRPGPNGVTLRPVPGGIQIVPNAADAGSVSEDDDSE